MPSNQFSNTYKSISDEQLVSIIDNKKDYKPQAIEAALLELKNRQLSDQQMSNARTLNEHERKQKAEAEQIAKERRDAAKNNALKVLGIFDPLVEKTPERSINVISFVLSILFLIKTISNFSFIIAMFQESEWDRSVALYFLDMLLLPVSLIFFWRKKKLGRFLLSAWLIKNIFSAAYLGFIIFSVSGSDYLLSLLPFPDLSTLIFTVIISAGLLYHINKKSIRVLFS